MVIDDDVDNVMLNGFIQSMRIHSNSYASLKCFHSNSAKVNMEKKIIENFENIHLVVCTNTHRHTNKRSLSDALLDSGEKTFEFLMY